MRKNGFTLIELLAVIVILAIIALIATPIILGIINDAREKANERSVELYASAVRNGIAAYQLREMKEVAAGTYTSETLPFDVEYVECTTIELYEDGGVYVAGCEVNDVEVEYTYGTKQEKKVYLNDVCDPVSVAETGQYTAGDKYMCTVDPNKSAYTFYVLTSVESDATSVNLIMDSNINISGTAVKEGVSDMGLVEWNAETENNSYGPITAMISQVPSPQLSHAVKPVGMVSVPFHGCACRPWPTPSQPKVSVYVTNPVTAPVSSYRNFSYSHVTPSSVTA